MLSGLSVERLNWFRNIARTATTYSVGRDSIADELTTRRSYVHAESRLLRGVDETYRDRTLSFPATHGITGTGGKCERHRFALLFDVIDQSIQHHPRAKHVCGNGDVTGCSAQG